MYLSTLGKFIYQGVDTVWGPFHPFGGAVDIVVVQQQDGTYKSSPWYVRFGKFQGLLKSREKIVNINVNGSDSDFHMFLDSKGEAFFLHSTIVDVEDPATSSPVSSGNEREDKDKTEGGENSDLNEGGTVKREDKNKTEGNENCDLNEGQSIKRTGSKRSILGFMFGGSSKSNNKGSDIERRSSFEKAEIAADLLEMKWSTNLSLSDKRAVRLDLSNLEGQDANLASNGIVERGVELDSINLRGPDENSQSNGIVEEISTREVELDSMNLRGHDENSPSNEELVEKVSTRGVELDYMNLRGQDENLVDNILRGETKNSDENDLEKVVKTQSTESNNSEIELNEKSYNITENETTSEEIIDKKCLEKTNKIEEKVTNNPDIDFDSSEINEEKMQDNSEINEIDFEEKELNLNPRLVSSNSDNSDLNLPNSIDTSSDASIDNKVLEVSSREYLSQISQITVSENSNDISKSGISEELQFPLSDEEGENETNEREAIESDNENNEETDNITNNAHNGSDRDTRLESSPIFIRNVNKVNNIAISLPNLWYDSVERVENIDRLSSSLGLQSEVERESDSLSNKMGRVESEITGQDSDASKPDNGGEEALVDPLVELSLCKHLLYQGMGQEAAQKAFESQKISLEKSPELLPNLVKNDKLIVKFKNQYFPYYSTTPVTLEQIKDSLDLTSMICVDQIAPAGGGWLWFFRRSRTVSSSTTYSVGNLGEVQGVDYKNVVKIKKVRSLTPSSAELASLGLKDGCNNVAFTFSTAMLGKQQVEARIFLWKWNTRIVISDVDGTITKSDVLGQFMPLVGIDWYQTGVAHLFSAIKDNGYQVLFLSARAISQAHLTRQFLVNLKQDGKALPDGPVVISPDGLFPSLYREVIRRAPHEFKISCLEAIKAVFPADYNPFYAGFGNRDTDELSYLKVGIPLGKIFIINPKGQVAVNRRVDTKSYNSLHALVNGMFPPYSSPEQEEYNTYNFWRLPMPEIDL